MGMPGSVSQYIDGEGMRLGKLMMDGEEEKAMGRSFTFEEHTTMNDNKLRVYDSGCASMTSPYTHSTATPQSFAPIQASSSDAGALSPPAPGRGRPRGSLNGTGAKRGRKPRGGGPLATVSPRPPAQETTTATTTASTYSSAQFSHLQWAMPTGVTAATTSNGTPTTPTIPGAASPVVAATSTALSTTSTYAALQKLQALHALAAQTSQFASSSQTTYGQTTTAATFPSFTSTSNVSIDLSKYALPVGSTIPSLNTAGLISMTGATLPSSLTSTLGARPMGVEEGDGEDELLPAMADEDYSAHSSWQSQSKDNLKCVNRFSFAHVSHIAESFCLTES